jgi:UDP-GlcNAc:undecaprenyl-phosphate GlcNAc-1-phosphate transferase
MNIFDNVIGPGRPLTWALHFWPVLVLSFGTALAATWLCKKIAVKFGIVDKPDNLVKTHKEPVAYLGGIGILIGMTTGLLCGIYMLSHHAYFGEGFKMLLGIMAGAAIACFVGVVDDILVMTPRQKIMGQIMAAIVLVVVGILPSFKFVETWGIPMPDRLEYVLGAITVVIFVLGATNSLNLLDGLDGLCAGVTAIILAAMLLLAIHLATWASNGLSDAWDPVRIIVCLALAGGVLGFLPFNRHPAKIFMGDAGSMLLGFVVAAMMILFARMTPRWWLASIVIFGLPILDTAVALVRRLLNHRPLFVSDRGHVYDQMIDRGIPLKKTVAICYALTAMYAGIGLAMSQVHGKYALIVYIVVFATSGIVVWKKGYLKMHGLRGAVPDKCKEHKV